jgi:hypothetical protein
MSSILPSVALTLTLFLSHFNFDQTVTSNQQMECRHQPSQHGV